MTAAELQQALETDIYYEKQSSSLRGRITINWYIIIDQELTVVV